MKIQKKSVYDNCALPQAALKIFDIWYYIWKA